MARPRRIEFAGALYHLKARGNAQQDIFIHDDDRCDFLEMLKVDIKVFWWKVIPIDWNLHDILY